MSNTRRRRDAAWLFAAALLTTAAVAFADQPALKSRWASSPGAAAEQAGPPPSAFTAIGPEKVFKLALSNNADRLHLTMEVTDDDARLLLLSRGFIVWFDPNGGQRQVFGVEFPLEPPPQRTPYFDPGRLLDQEQKSGHLDQLAIVTGRGPGRTLQRSDAPGIRVSIRNEAGVLTYTLDVPLTRSPSEPYAIGARPGSVIGLGLATPERQQVRLGPPPRALSSRPGGDEQSESQERRRRESGDGAIRGRIRDWTTVKLAVP